MKKEIKDTFEILVIIAITSAFVFSFNKSVSNAIDKLQNKEVKSVQNIKNDTIAAFNIKTR